MTAKPACRELLPCPCCGDEPREEYFRDESVYSHADVVYLQIVCDECGIRSRNSEDQGEVREEWNRRHTPPSSEAGKWVPLVPDTAMIEAGRKAMEQQDPVRVSHARVMWLWNDMLAASPSEPRQGAGKEEK